MDVVEPVAQRRRAELAERVAQVHPALAAPAEAEPLAQPQRGVDALLAHAVLLDRPDDVLGAGEVRSRPPVGEPVGVVRVEQQASDPVLELPADRALLERGEPARQRRRHRVVRRRQHHLVERPVAQLVVPVAAGDRRRRRGRAAAGVERGERARDDERGDRRHDDPRQATDRRHLGVRRRRPVDEPQEHLARPRRAGTRRPASRRSAAVASGSAITSTPAAISATPRTTRRPLPVRLGRRDPPRAAQPTLDLDRVDHRRGGRGDRPPRRRSAASRTCAGRRGTRPRRRRPPRGSPGPARSRARSPGRPCSR